MNIDKFYLAGKRLAGELGMDLVHHCYLEVQNKSDAYFYKSMVYQWVNPVSTFNKQYRPHQEINQELFDVPQIEFDYVNYDAVMLHTILLELEIEGHEIEVQVFKDCYLGIGKRSLNRQTKIHIDTLTKICTFVLNEIKKRYEFSEQ